MTYKFSVSRLLKRADRHQIELWSKRLLVLYALARPVVLIESGASWINAGVFLLIDLATIKPYVDGISELVRSLRPRRHRSIVRSASKVSMAFAAPYVWTCTYQWATTGRLPTAFIVWLTVFVGMGLVLLVSQVRQPFSVRSSTSVPEGQS